MTTYYFMFPGLLVLDFAFYLHHCMLSFCRCLRAPGSGVRSPSFEEKDDSRPCVLTACTFVILPLI
jgi:hypothetical protein